MKTLILSTAITFLALSASAFAAEFTKDPVAYAERSAKEYAEGDMNNSSGFEGCEESELSNPHSPKLVCNGTRTILFHGGEAIRTSFVCEFEFRLVTKARGYKVVREDCE